MDAAPAPVLDEALLDELARVYMRAALDELMRGLPVAAGTATAEENEDASR